MRVMALSVSLAVAACSSGAGDDVGPAAPEEGTAGAAGTAGASGSGGRSGGGGAGAAGGRVDGGGSGGAANTGGSAGKGGSSGMAGGSSGGAANTGGSAGTGGSGMAGGSSGGAGGDAGAACSPAAGLPSDAPAFKAGVWQNINPAGVNFHSGGTDVFTQGITFDPCHPATLYLSVSSFDLAGGNPGVYKSTNAGSTWRKVGQLDEPIHVRVDPRNSSHLLAADGVRGGTVGFWVSTDAGETWAKPEGFKGLCAQAGISTMCGLDDVYDVAPDPNDFDHVLLTFHSPWNWNEFSAGAGIVETKDAGATWILHKRTDWGQGHGVWFLGNSATWLVGTQSAGFWRTSDAGATWTQVEQADNMEHGGGQIYKSKSGVIYTAGVPRMIKSSDDGLTWTPIGPSVGYNGIVGDGTNLYTAPNTEPGALGPGFITALESNDTVWTKFPDSTVLKGPGAAGPFEMAYDAANGIVYAGCWGAGVWALKVR